MSKRSKLEGTMSLTEAYTRGLMLVGAAVGSVFIYRFLHDVYNYVVHGKTLPS